MVIELIRTGMAVCKSRFAEPVSVNTESFISLFVGYLIFSQQHELNMQMRFVHFHIYALILREFFSCNSGFLH